MNNWKRNQQLKQAADSIVASRYDWHRLMERDAGGATVNFVERNQALLKCRDRLVAETGCTPDTAHRHILKAVKRVTQ